MRETTVERKTKETHIRLHLNLDGGEVSVETGVGFFDHMLTAFAVHGGFGLELACQGDLQVDCHHTVEDTGIVLGEAFARALGDKSRSEEHTSELQSRFELVCRLLLEKKKLSKTV